uniref:Uncharacterized protein LOC100181186 n=1 Tax=Phallusia mammillata TaxID=59560 RepID=A0A6F9DHY0_9ASCI|nr:uncharacterized protein LOC100181186 [Phallusia mammillata]
MLPFNSPPAPSQSSSDSAVSDGLLFPKNTRLSLNGLFGESTGIDEPMPSTFAIYPSPPPGSHAFGRHHLTSPSKSPTNVMLGAQQSILLSDLAETNTNANFYQNILCSYVSDYDNRRCTNPAVENRFCPKHAQLSTIHFPTSSNSFSNPQFSCNETQTFQSKGVDLFDGNMLAPQTPSVVCNQQKHGVGQTYPSSSDPCPSVVMVDTSPSNNHHQIKKALKFNKNKQTSISNNQPTPINSEVLRTVVDMLNRNRSGLTTKQQIKLLNSLGVIVATVKNPAELSSGNVVMQQQSTNNSHHPIFPGPSVQHVNNIQPAQTMYMGNQAPVHGQAGLNVLPPPVISSVNISQPKLKRKNPSNANIIAAKKIKKFNCDSERSSLQHLTAVELDERVSEALASVGGLTNHHKPVNKTAKPMKSKKKVLVEKKAKKTSNRLNIASSSLSISPNPKFIHGITSYETSCPPVNKYVEFVKSQFVKNHDLFSLGPFCDDQAFGVCKCKQLQYKLQTPKPKRKSLFKILLKVKKCLQCSTSSLEDTEKVSVPFCLSSLALVHNDEMSCAGSQNKNPEFVFPDPDLDQTTVSNSCKLATASHSGDLGNSSTDASNFQKSKLDNLKTVSTHRTHIASYKKHLKNQLSQEKKALQYLCAAAKADSQGIAKALRHLGTNYISCKRIRAPVLTEKCMLAGGQCFKPPLPKTCYCSEHIWHCKEQQLFKLGTDMKVVPDIFPDPVVLKPRKKAKIPALSKRKKRKIRKNAAVMKLQGKVVDGFEDCVSMNSHNTQSVQVKPEKDGTVSQLVNVDDVDEEKMKVIPPNEKSCDSLTSTSMEDAVLDAFNIGDSTFMDDIMPDLLQDFGLFTGKNSDVLDNALLLASAVESDYPDQFASDKMGDTTLLFSQANMGEINSTSKAHTGVSSSYHNNSLADPNNTSLASTTLQLPSSSTLHCTNSGFNTDNSVSKPDDYMLSLSQTTWSQPMTSQGYDIPYSTPSEDIGNMSSSTDQFFEDLSEIEGVLQSLREEVTGDNCNSPMCPKDMDADEYTSILAKEISQYAENQVTSKAALLKQQNDQISDTSLNLPVTESLVHTCDAGAQTNYNSFSTNAFPNTANQFIELSTMKKLRKSPPKRSKSNVSINKSLSSDSSSEHVLQSHDENVLKNQHIVAHTSLSGLKVASTTSVGVKQTTPKVESTKGRSARKPKCSNPVPGYITPGMSPLIAIAQPCRMQPNILAGNVICSPGNVTSPSGNPSMLLIPVNAIVQSGSSGVVAGSPNQVGLAVAMQPGQTCIPANFGTVIPVRGSTVVPGANMPQQFIIVNGNQLSHPVAIRANKRQKTTAKHQTNIVTSPSSGVSRTNVPIVQQPPSSTILSQTPLAPNVAPSAPNPTLHSSLITTTNESHVKWSKPMRSSPLVIPPVISGASGAQVTAESNVSTTVTAPSVQKLPGDKKSGKCGTVHWNQSTMSTEAAPPLPQARVYGEAGGQTSNMLYCRRISPSLNNNHQVIVGRLGSLGHVGVSRLAVNERLSQYQKQQNFANAQSKHVGEKVKVNGGSEKKTKASPGFINIAKSCKAPEVDITSKPTSIEARPIQEQCTVSETMGISQPKVVSASTNVIGLKRNSRKTEHTEMLQDPDFCEVLIEGNTPSKNNFPKNGPG